MFILSDVYSLFFQQPLSPVPETAMSVTWKRCVYATMVLVLPGTISHLYTTHYLDGAWDIASLILGVLALNRIVRDGQRGLSLRYVVWYAALSIFNAFLYVAAFVFQQYKGYPPILPANPSTDWSLLTSKQQHTALVTYALEQVPYCLMAVAAVFLYRELKSRSSYRPAGSSTQGTAAAAVASGSYQTMGK